jgi:hypothetical protein
MLEFLPFQDVEPLFELDAKGIHVSSTKMRRYGIEFDLLSNCENISEVTLPAAVKFRSDEHRAVNDASSRRTYPTTCVLLSAVVIEVVERPLRFGLTASKSVH